MPLQLANTSFTSGPDNKAATVDVYKDPPKRPTNATPGLATDTNGIGGAVNKSSNPFSDILKEVAKGYATNGKVDWDGALNRASGVTGQTSGEMKTYTGMVTDDILKSLGFYNTELGKRLDAITKVAGGSSLEKSVQAGFKNIDVTQAGLKTTMRGFKDITNLQTLSDYIASISDDDEFIKIFNLSDTLAVYKALNKAAVEFNLPGVMDKLIEKLSDDEKKQVVTASAKDNYAISDLDYLQTMLSHASGEELLGQNPNLIADILANFRSTTSYPEATEATAKKLDETLKKIRKEWMYKFIDGQSTKVYDLDVFKNASTFTKECFFTFDMYVDPLAIAGTYDIVPFKKALSGKYKYLNWS
jgi:CRISPR/Cas system CSM-associated protein Csm2 small subunit